MLSSLRMSKYEWWPLTQPVGLLTILLEEHFQDLCKDLASVLKREIGPYEAHSVGSSFFGDERDTGF